MGRTVLPFLLVTGALCQGCAARKSMPAGDVSAGQPQVETEAAVPARALVATELEREQALQQHYRLLEEKYRIASGQITAYQKRQLLRDPLRPWIGAFSIDGRASIVMAPSGLVTMTGWNSGEWGQVVEATPSVIRVSLEAPDPVLLNELDKDRSPELFYFRWREHDFVATSAMFDKYVEECNDGKDPQRGLDAFPIREGITTTGPGGVPRGPIGVPPLPPKYQARLLHHPLTMKVVKAVALPRDSEPGHNPAIFDVVLDKGSDDGVFEGMEFGEDAAGRTQRIRVYEVMTRRSIARIIVSKFRTTDKPPIQEGTTFFLPGVKTPKD